MHYSSSLRWEHDGQDFASGRFSRHHRIIFDGGQEIVASSSPHVLPVPVSDSFGIDPEEAFVAALSSCHMLWFLVIATKRRFPVARYTDDAHGTMAKDREGKVAMTEVVLNPRVTFSGSLTPTEAEHTAMHHEAHARCFIANSVKSEVFVCPAFT